MANSSFHEHAPHLSVVEARQGQRGRHILTVLIVSVALAGIVLALVWGFHAGQFRRDDTRVASNIAAASPRIAPSARTAPPMIQNPATTGLKR